MGDNKDKIITGLIEFLSVLLNIDADADSYFEENNTE